MLEKKEIIAKFGKKESDTGSPEVQIAILTERIKQITEHMKGHKKDFHSRRGLLMLVSKRRKLLNYLAKKDYKKFEELIKSLNLRHA
ncbi:MAG TPA: 30S ribosomal protein S15 [Victivallales bacterium]|nr:30S ribosomal protein S15 [Victivallales bacterium]HPO89700.1 30S ribosomal protein S15 [Victivallales bacterium]HRR28827.1 30S ribosomal protein S15 [Victivallales bacterium]HRU00198.1 30S ribosomal protein S15 [Victivallales bacterium]